MFTSYQKTVALVTTVVALSVLTACGGGQTKLAQPEAKAPGFSYEQRLFNSENTKYNHTRIFTCITPQNC